MSRGWVDRRAATYTGSLMSERLDRQNYFLAFGWITASMAGAVVGWWFLNSVVQRYMPFDILFSLPGILLVRGVTVGASVGFFQSRALERLHAGAGHWILRTAAAYLAASSVVGILTPMLMFLPLTTTGRFFVEVPVLLAGGVIMGAIQSTGLARDRVSRAAWILTVAVGWTLGSIVPFVVPGLGRFAYFPNAFTHGLWGIVVGLATLYPLRGLLRDA